MGPKKVPIPEPEPEPVIEEEETFAEPYYYVTEDKYFIIPDDWQALTVRDPITFSVAQIVREIEIIKEEERLAEAGAEKKKKKKEEEPKDDKKKEEKEDAKALAKLLKAKQEEERRLLEEQQVKEKHEHYLRVDQITRTYNIYVELQYAALSEIEKQKRFIEWQLLLRAEKLPDPANVIQMKTYLDKWNDVINEISIEQVGQRVVESLYLLKELELRMLTRTDFERRAFYENWKWIKAIFRGTLRRSVDIATYRLLRDVERHIHRINVFTADYFYGDPRFKYYLWTKIPLPTCLPFEKKGSHPQKIKLTNAAIGMTVLFPLSMNCVGHAFRMMYQKYDHFSDTCAGFYEPKDFLERTELLPDFLSREWRLKKIFRYERSSVKEQIDQMIAEKLEREKLMREGEGEEEQEMVFEPKITVPKSVEFKRKSRDEDDIPTAPPEVYDPTPEEYLNFLDIKVHGVIKKQMLRKLQMNEVNLRTNVILGGLFYIEYIRLPQQPHEFIELDGLISRLLIRELEIPDFFIPAIVPPYPEPAPLPADFDDLSSIDKITVEEDIQKAFVLAIKRREEEIAAIFDGLIFVELAWPLNVFFFEPPQVCQWDEARRIWTTEEVYDLEYDDETNKVTFKTGKLGALGFFTKRWLNLPFRMWEMYPTPEGNAALKVECNIAKIEITIRPDGFAALTGFSNADYSLVKDIAGNFMSLARLMMTLKSTGIDIFPEIDTIYYQEESNEKRLSIERHLYFCMAHLSLFFSFKSSRFNQTLDLRKICIQMREWIPPSTSVVKKAVVQPEYSLLFVTPYLTTFLAIKEKTKEFSEGPKEGMKFVANLWYLMRFICSVIKKTEIEGSPKDLVYWMYELLMAVRPISYTHYTEKQFEAEIEVEKPKKKGKL